MVVQRYYEVSFLEVEDTIVKSLVEPVVADTLEQLHRQARGDWKRLIGVAPGSCSRSSPVAT
jgi:hypothetical protein